MKKILILGTLVVAATSIFLAGNQAKAFLPGNTACHYYHNGELYETRFIVGSVCPDVPYELHSDSAPSVQELLANGEDPRQKIHNPDECVLETGSARTDI
ncbi:MAG: hypothetical protein OQK04_16320 [Kangiellaceae bacterium]|nr:hypothetical protein [Kangiellaceae bacterium]MCW9000275.1 hypothetical protein [Kangiellaceae bacterium]